MSLVLATVLSIYSLEKIFITIFGTCAFFFGCYLNCLYLGIPVSCFFLTPKLEQNIVTSVCPLMSDSLVGTSQILVSNLRFSENLANQYAKEPPMRWGTICCAR